MKKYKQIEEMAKVIQNGELSRNRGDLDCTEFPTDIVIKVGLQRLAGAKALYNEGYRKQVVGDWIEDVHERDFPYDYTDYKCSCCGNREQNRSPFCRECGAKMKGD